MTDSKSAESIRREVREYYASWSRAKATVEDCGCATPSAAASCCQPKGSAAALPGDIADSSLGCADPVAAAALQPGETVLDLGSGGGLDCIVAARQVGQTGRVIGVDMTEEMLSHARGNIEHLGLTNVEFRKGLIEAMPVEQGSVDVLISNCVVNLSPDKPAVFREITRVLRPGGRLSIGDIVTLGELRADLKTMKDSWAACVAGALTADEYVEGLHQAGLAEIALTPADGRSLAEIPVGLPFSAIILARKPAN
jgi:arsenite methyltransferase